MPQFEVFAQAFPRPHQIVRQKRPSIAVLAPGQRHKRRFGHPITYTPGRARFLAGRLGASIVERGLRLGETDRMIFTFGQHPVQGRPARRRDPIAQDATGRIADDPAFQRHRLGHRTVDDSGARRVPIAGFADHHGLVHLGGHGQNRACFAQTAQDSAGLGGQSGFGQGGTAGIIACRRGHSYRLLDLRTGKGLIQNLPPKTAQPLVNQKIVPP